MSEQIERHKAILIGGDIPFIAVDAVDHDTVLAARDARIAELEAAIRLSESLINLLRSEKTIRGDGNPPGATIAKCEEVLQLIDALAGQPQQGEPRAAVSVDEQCDRQYRAGFNAGWNAGVAGDYAAKKAVENRVLSKDEYNAEPCQGANCGSTDGLTHSAECLQETAESQGWEEQPEEGRDVPPNETALRRAGFFLDRLNQNACNEVKTLRKLIAAAHLAGRLVGDARSEAVGCQRRNRREHEVGSS